MSEAVCWRCGTREAESWRFCSVKREYVCINCERSCPSYSRQMLSSGIHCLSLYAKENAAQKVLSRRFIASPAAVAEAREYWKRRKVETLPDILQKAVEKYDASDDAEYRADVRAHITAMQDLIREAEGMRMI